MSHRLIPTSSFAQVAKRSKKYPDAALQLAKKLIQNFDGKVALRNDFHEVPHPHRVRDASTGAISVFTFQELARHKAADAEILFCGRRVGNVCELGDGLRTRMDVKLFVNAADVRVDRRPADV